MSRFKELLYEEVVKDDVRLLHKQFNKINQPELYERYILIEKSLLQTFKELKKKGDTKNLSQKISPIIKNIKSKLTTIEKVRPIQNSNLSKKRLDRMKSYSRGVEAQSKSKKESAFNIKKILKQLEEELQMFDDEVNQYKDYIERLHRHIWDVNDVYSKRWQTQLDHGYITQAQFDEYTKAAIMDEE